jgi:hypothetical protein
MVNKSDQGCKKQCIGCEKENEEKEERRRIGPQSPIAKAQVLLGLIWTPNKAQFKLKGPIAQTQSKLGLPCQSKPNPIWAPKNPKPN